MYTSVIKKWLLTIGIALMLIGFYRLLDRYYLTGEKQQVLFYKQCKVVYKYYGDFIAVDITYINTNRNLAICLCEAYQQTHDSNIAQRIISMYKPYGHKLADGCAAFENTHSADTLSKYRNEIFAPTTAF